MTVNGLCTYCLELINDGLVLGVTFAALLLLRPLLERVFSPQQRVVIWLVGWLDCCGWVTHRGRKAILPISFQDLMFHRRGRLLSNLPAILPPEYTGEGRYNLVLPGDVLVQISLWDWLLLGLLFLWAAGVAVLLAIFWRRSRALAAAVKRGRRLADDDPLLEQIPLLKKSYVEVWVWPSLPVSFVSYTPLNLLQGILARVCVQEELPRERLELVLLHEARHISLWHCFWKWSATAALVIFWWNPIVWAAFRALGRDMELACDASVLKRIPPERRKEYAKTLLELGTGRQLWAVPLAFGECDGAVRVKAAVRWKGRRWWRQIPTWAAALCLAAFFMGSHWRLSPPQDMPLAWERETGSADNFARDLGREMYEDPDSPLDSPAAVEQVWRAPGRWVFAPEQISALWVRTEDGRWYHVDYAWWGNSTGWIGVLGVDETSAPDLSGQTPVYQRGEGD